MFKRPFLGILLCAALAASAGCGSSQQAANKGADNVVDAEPPPPVMPEPSYPATVQREVSLAMDDGVHLGGTLTFPSLDGAEPAPGTFPVVLSMTPYSRT